MDLEINNEREFYDKVRIDKDGQLRTVVVTKTGAETKAGTAREFYERIAFDENGNIKTYI